MANRYWVGGAGSWYDDEYHWSDSSGGSPSIGNLPTSSDSVFFDANSGLSTYDAVYGGAGDVCNSITCTVGDIWSISNPGNPLTISGSVTLEADFDGAAFDATLDCQSSATITSNGASFQNVVIHNGSGGGTFTLADNFSCYQLTTGDMTFDANDHNVTASYSIKPGFEYNGGTIYMGSGTWQSPNWDNQTASSIVIDSETSTLKLVNDAGGIEIFSDVSTTVYYNLWLTGSHSDGFNIWGEHTFNQIKVDGSSKTVYFEDGMTQSVSSFIAVGDGTKTYTLTSISGGTWYLSKSSGTVDCDYLDLSWSDASGGATWNAGENSTDSGNNSGWIFDVGTVDASSRNAEILCGYIVTSNRGASIHGYNLGDSAREVSIHGYDTSQDSRGAIITGTDSLWIKTAKPTTSWNKVAKVTTNWSKVTKPTTSWSKTAKP